MFYFEEHYVLLVLKNSKLYIIKNISLFQILAESQTSFNCNRFKNISIICKMTKNKEFVKINKHSMISCPEVLLTF